MPVHQTPVLSEQPSLLTANDEASHASTRTLDGRRIRLPLNRLDPDPRNPRAPTPAEVEELAASIRASGLLQPILVRPQDDRYIVVAGHRRLAAVRRCALEAPDDPRWRSIEATVRLLDADEALALLLVENLQRRALSPLEEAVALAQLRETRGWTNRQVADAIKKSEMYVSRRLRVLADPELKRVVLGRQLRITTAEELLAAPESARGNLIARALEAGWSPDEARTAVRAARQSERVAAAAASDWTAVVGNLDGIAAEQLSADGQRAVAEAARRLLERLERRAA